MDSTATTTTTHRGASLIRRVALCAAACLLVPGSARAQAPTQSGQFPPVVPPATAPGQFPPVAAAPVPAARPQSFVLVAMSGDPSVDSFLRTTADQLHQQLGSRGYVDVDPAKVSQGIAADPSGISTLRARLGAACMLRIDVASHAADRVALTIAVQTDAGDKTAAVYAAPAEIPARVLAAVDPLLPPAIAPPPAPAGLDRVLLTDGTGIDCNVVGMDRGTAILVRLPDGQQRTIPWSQVAQIRPHAASAPSGWDWARSQGQGAAQPGPGKPVSWARRGGSLLTFDVQAQIVGMLVDLRHAYSIQYPDGQSMRFTGMSASGGGGGGLGFHLGFLQLAIPEPAEGNTIWGLNFGTGLDLAAVAFGYRTESSNIVGQYSSTGNIPDRQTGGGTQWSSAYVVQIPLLLGGQVGVGHFEAGRSWHGVTLGLDWRPTYTYAKPSSLDSISSYNYLGIGAHVDVGSLQGTADTPEANFRFSAVYLPMIDNHATYASLGFGAVWY